VTKPANWSELLGSCNDAEFMLFDAAFVAQSSQQAWPPSDEDRAAAGKLHGQLVSRIATQRLPYVDGEEAAALNSVYQLFGETREIFKDHPTCAMTNAIGWYVLNTHVRPFTAKWHRLSERGALAALDGTDIFRSELIRLHPFLVRFDELLVAIRDVQKLVKTTQTGETDQERAVVAEMHEGLPRGIDKKLGGLTEETAEKINTKEGAAILARREYYYKRLHPDAPKRDGAARQAPPSDNAPAQQQGRHPAAPVTATAEPWERDLHATALAISGGGIRSATFALGVLIALARRNLLPQFDYLSTVSGGGYIGSFLTTFLNTPDPVGKPLIGLLREDLPFRREDGEAAALRHVRHHSKYLATGRLWERLQMAIAQAFGMALNGLGFAYLAGVAAIVEYLLRLVLPASSLWFITMWALVIVASISFLISMSARHYPRLQKISDNAMTLAGIGLIVVLLWEVLDIFHALENPSWPLIFFAAALPLLASAMLALGLTGLALNRIALIVLAVFAAPVLFLGIEFRAYGFLKQGYDLPIVGAYGSLLIGCALAIVGLAFFWRILDINFTAPHQLYKRKLGEAYLVQPGPANGEASLRENVSLKLADCTRQNRAPYHLVNCALNVPASTDSRMQGRLTDFFLFSPAFCGSPLTDYAPTKDWQTADKALDLGTAMAISGAAAGPQMGTGTIKNLSFWLALFNIRLGYWIRNPAIERRRWNTPPGLSYLLQEMFGWATEKRAYINVSDGGHIENLGVYELLRRRCKYIVAIDGEQDPKMTFHGLTTLQRLASIDLGVKIDIGVDTLRLSDKGLSHSHFAFCRIHYPRDERDGAESYGYMMYLKLSLTGNEGEFIRRYRLDEPDFPHHSTADQFFTEAQFEAYRSLGEHIGDKMFLPALVESMPTRNDGVKLEEWFQAVGKNTLEALPEYLDEVRQCRARHNASQAAPEVAASVAPTPISPDPKSPRDTA